MPLQRRIQRFSWLCDGQPDVMNMFSMDCMSCIPCPAWWILRSLRAARFRRRACSSSTLDWVVPFVAGSISWLRGRPQEQEVARSQCSIQAMSFLQATMSLHESSSRTALGMDAGSGSGAGHPVAPTTRQARTAGAPSSATSTKLCSTLLGYGWLFVDAECSFS